MVISENKNIYLKKFNRNNFNLNHSFKLVRILFLMSAYLLYFLQYTNDFDLIIKKIIFTISNFLNVKQIFLLFKSFNNKRYFAFH
ncbi:hypothetical protein H311_01105 [Anncaliia algerae PRA109]|nr:hypothetical protein H311_01105 [Anncaliia algerae PRA109]